jgi:hypothetical protein
MRMPTDKDGWECYLDAEPRTQSLYRELSYVPQSEIRDSES